MEAFRGKEEGGNLPKKRLENTRTPVRRREESYPRGKNMLKNPILRP